MTVWNRIRILRILAALNTFAWNLRRIQFLWKTILIILRSIRKSLRNKIVFKFRVINTFSFIFIQSFILLRLITLVLNLIMTNIAMLARINFLDLVTFIQVQGFFETFFIQIRLQHHWSWVPGILELKLAIFAIVHIIMIFLLLVSIGSHILLLILT